MFSSVTFRWPIALTLVTLLVLLTVAPGRAQVDVRGQLRFGAAIASLDGPHGSGGYLAVTDRSSIRGVTGGLGIAIVGSGWISGEADLLVAQKGTAETLWDDQGRRWEARHRLTYLEMPVVMHLHPLSFQTVIPYLQSGVAPAINLRSNASTSADYDAHTDLGFETIDLGLVIGAGIRTDLLGPTVSADFRYIRGLRSARQQTGLQPSSAVHEAFTLSGGLWF